MRRTALRGLLLLALTGTLTACSHQGEDARPRASVSWRAADLPMPPGPAGRLAVRDAVRCADRWYVAGGVFGGPDESRPALWSSTDLTTWRVERLAPTDYWAQRSIFSSVACRDGQVAMLGSKAGGAHGIPRVNSWHQRADGTFVDVVSGYTLYGGPQGVSVGRLVGAPPGWLIAGNRTSGASVWTSPDAKNEFTRNDQDPALQRDSSFDPTALDQAWDGTEWTVVGSATTPGRVPRVPFSWISRDGRSWEREEVPATQEFNDLERVVALDDGLLAVGLRGQGFATWTRRDGSWRTGERFGALDEDGRAAPFVASLTRSGQDLLATVSDGARYQLWFAPGGKAWLPVPTPERPRTAGEHTLAVAADAGHVLLLSDDGHAGRLWIASGSPKVMD